MSSNLHYIGWGIFFFGKLLLFICAILDTEPKVYVYLGLWSYTVLSFRTDDQRGVACRRLDRPTLNLHFHLCQNFWQYILSLTPLSRMWKIQLVSFDSDQDHLRYLFRICSHSCNSVHQYSATLYTNTVQLCTPIQCNSVHQYSATLYTNTVQLCTPIQSNSVHQYSATLYTNTVQLCTPIQSNSHIARMCEICNCLFCEQALVMWKNWQSWSPSSLFPDFWLYLSTLNFKKS